MPLPCIILLALLLLPLSLACSSKKPLTELQEDYMPVVQTDINNTMHRNLAAELELHGAQTQDAPLRGCETRNRKHPAHPNLQNDEAEGQLHGRADHVPPVLHSLPLSREADPRAGGELEEDEGRDPTQEEQAEGRPAGEEDPLQSYRHPVRDDGMLRDTQHYFGEVTTESPLTDHPTNNKKIKLPLCLPRHVPVYISLLWVFRVLFDN